MEGKILELTMDELAIASGGDMAVVGECNKSHVTFAVPYGTMTIEYLDCGHGLLNTGGTFTPGPAPK
jgi:hypothetical protein